MNNKTKKILLISFANAFVLTLTNNSFASMCPSQQEKYLNDIVYNFNSEYNSEYNNESVYRVRFFCNVPEVICYTALDVDNCIPYGSDYSQLLLEIFNSNMPHSGRFVRDIYVTDENGNAVDCLLSHSNNKEVWYDHFNRDNFPDDNIAIRISAPPQHNIKRLNIHINIDPGVVKLFKQIDNGEI